MAKCSGQIQVHALDVRLRAVKGQHPGTKCGGQGQEAVFLRPTLTRPSTLTLALTVQRPDCAAVLANQSNTRRFLSLAL